ncbi:SGNH/GDSL hydrolase family protein [Aquabacterium humicola]|uniref:SGNH/GDSL hydrolase family protein n=1 Tax=Aquabacterium humicola TaxID=3237377 RepID=UPI0025439C8D|nr:SGNH/GDSL hydrolase family protein [Rubrivivax pictus]
MTSSTPSRRTGWRLAITAALAAALLAACGGGTSQIEPFAPGRLIVLGDEHSLIVNDGANNGRKYTVNGVTSDAIPIRDCTLNPLWVEALSNHYGFVFAECNKNNATPKAFMRAKAGAKVEDAATGIARQLGEQTTSGGSLQSNDLVTVMMGSNDLVELSDRVIAGTMSEADAVGEARRRAGVLAAQINGLLGAGAKAIVSTVPDMGVTPYAINLNKTKAGAATRLSNLSYEFNATLRTSIDQTRFDGRNYALVLTDDTVSTISRFPGNFGYTNVVDGVCAVALPNCTSVTADLVSGGVVASYMWADDRRLAPSMHSRIGSAALTRALNNPF